MAPASTGMRQLDNAYRLSKNIKITMLYLEDDDPVSAEQYIKKASALISASTDEVLDLQFKTCYARIMDAKRRWVLPVAAIPHVIYSINCCCCHDYPKMTMGQQAGWLSYCKSAICLARCAARHERVVSLSTMTRPDLHMCRAQRPAWPQVLGCCHSLL